MPVSLTQSEGLCLIGLEGEIDIASATELKKLLLQALGSGQEVRVDVERATEMDVTALQLLWAAEREARGAGRAIRLAGRVPDEIAVSVGESGFEQFPIPADSK
ncbi:MAG: STAS domain-containing protein [Terriglobales bacterium]